MKRKPIIAVIATAAAGLLLLAGCDLGSKMTEPFADAPRGATNKGPADVMTMPDGFSNVAAKCDGTNRVYVIFKQDYTYGSIAVAPNSKLCGGTN